MQLLSTDIKNKVLDRMVELLQQRRNEVIAANKKDLDAFNRDDQALYDRLVVDSAKVDDMARAVSEVRAQEDPIGKVLYDNTLSSGLHVTNKSAPFGTIMIIYESRPDVTIEAAVLAFKANNKILLKGGKEALNSNLILVELWHQALKEHGLDNDWIQYMQKSREETQEFLRNPDQPLDLIVPRGGERLIDFVKEHARCAVLVSGRGNNFAYVAPDADVDLAIKVIVNAKTDKISGCNALDKVLVDAQMPQRDAFVQKLAEALKAKDVELIADEQVRKVLPDAGPIPAEDAWYEEFLALKALIALTDDEDDAIKRINHYSGHHSATILTQDKAKAARFMEQIDSAAVYHNASTRFTDGGQMGVGAELAISTDKLHHRGPLGLPQLVTNKYYVHGEGHIRS
ncbi:MAG: glutamate-5-semialdehyde dehydrogenase [Schleiferiaceae bacterium]|nr:glutamate-5-semialdehyde dehydrogenase [Schleiferiaceae bacterium]MDR9442127.1 glutamate-5-semialdehyde dehydrogenase [Schleiferiaceae bacterium]